MKRSLIIVSLLLTLSTIAIAKNNSRFIGIDSVKYTNSINGSATINGTTYSGSSDTFISPNIKLGIETKSSRKYVSYSLLYKKNNILYESYNLNYDKFLKRIEGLTPYIGVHIGMGKLDIDGTSDSSIEYGIQCGMINQYEKMVSAEIGFKYKKGTASLNGTNSSSSETIEVNNARALYIGINRKF